MDSNSRILLVEDDDSIRELIEEMLNDEGYELTAVRNGLEAKELLKTRKFDLIITDFKMPGLDGIELIRWCRVQNIQSSVMFMTGAGKLVPDDASAVSESQATVFPKPLNLEKFLKTVQNSLSGHQSLDLICS